MSNQTQEESFKRRSEDQALQDPNWYADAGNGVGVKQVRATSWTSFSANVVRKGEVSESGSTPVYYPMKSPNRWLFGLWQHCHSGLDPESTTLIIIKWFDK